MRLALVPLLTLALTGCSTDVPTKAGPPPSVPLRPPGLGFRVKWPGSPRESGGPGRYSAALTVNTPQGEVTYSASVNELPTAELAGKAPRDVLAAKLAGTAGQEFSRKEVAVGPKKYPGLDVTWWGGATQVGRRLAVLAGAKVYELSVWGPDMGSIRSPEAEAFFNSLTIDESTARAAVGSGLALTSGFLAGRVGNPMDAPVWGH